MVLGRTCSESLTTGPTDEQHDANSDGDPKMGPMTSWVDGVCETNGSQTHYIRTGGSKPSVVLLHGLMGSGATWTPLARALEAGFDVVMPDARGHGRSSAPKPGHGYNDLASDVVALITGLDLMRPVLVGHSMGAMTATIAAGSSDLDLAGLILVDPTFLDAERQQQVWESDVAGQHGDALTRPRSELLAEARARHPHRSAEIVELQVDARLRTHMNTFDVLRPRIPSTAISSANSNFRSCSLLAIRRSSPPKSPPSSAQSTPTSRSSRSRTPATGFHSTSPSTSRERWLPSSGCTADQRRSRVLKGPIRTRL